MIVIASPLPLPIGSVQGGQHDADYTNDKDGHPVRVRFRVVREVSAAMWAQAAVANGVSEGLLQESLTAMRREGCHYYEIDPLD